MASTIMFSEHFRPEEVKVWKHVPFEVPEGVHQFHISINYNDRIDSSPLLSGGNTLDVGLFDPQGTESGSPGLRGWSGSVRTEITIDEHWATPPYRAGAIQPGEWNLLLGAYKTGPNGLTADVTVTFNSQHAAPMVPPVPKLADLQRASLPAAAEPGWYRGDLHMHTVYSDGDSYPHELAAHAYAIGLDFYGITDHNRAQSPVSLVPHGNGWPVLVPGVEVTSYAGHFNVWGGPDTWYDFRDYSARGQQAAVDAARADGALVSLNHPKPYGPMWEHPEVTGFECLEPWNGWFGALNNLSVGYWADALNADSAERWHVGVGGSDMHKLKTPGVPGIPVSPATMGYPTLWIRTDDELLPENIIAAIRAGDCFISESPSGPQLYVKRDGNTITARVVGANGDVLFAVDGGRCIRANAIDSRDVTLCWPIDEVIPEGERFVRFELHTPGGGIRALSNPIWK
jgi:hypothetical protein